jgi:hypothetical protein
MGTLDRYLSERNVRTAQVNPPPEMPEGGSDMLIDEGQAPKAPEVVLKPGQPGKAGGGKAVTPDTVPYIEDEPTKLLVTSIQESRTKVDQIKDKAKEILAEAKKAAAAVEAEGGVSALEQKIHELLQPLSDGLEKMDLQSEIIFRQFNGIIVALKRVREMEHRQPAAEQKLRFVLDELEQADAVLRKTIDEKLAAYVTKSTELIPTIQNLVHFYPKPKKVQNVRTAADSDTVQEVIGFIMSAARTLAGFFSDAFTIKTHLNKAMQAVSELEYGI